MKTNELLLALDEQRKNLAANLSQKGVAASNAEGLSALVPKVLNIASGGGSDNLDMSWVVSSRTTVSGQYAVFTEWKTVIPDFDKVFCVISAREDSLIICTKENIQNRTIDTSTQNIFIPGQAYDMFNSAFTTWDIVKYATGIRFTETQGVQLMQNGSAWTPKKNECFIIVQERG